MALDRSAAPGRSRRLLSHTPYRPEVVVNLTLADFKALGYFLLRVYIPQPNSAMFQLSWRLCGAHGPPSGHGSVTGPNKKCREIAFDYTFLLHLARIAE